MAAVKYLIFILLSLSRAFNMGLVTSDKPSRKIADGDRQCHQAYVQYRVDFKKYYAVPRALR